MELAAVMEHLQSVGKEETAKIYQRHGAGDDVFGVTYAHLKKLKKKIGTDHELALELWKTGNSDARSLAMMVADPDDVTPTVATQWMKDVSYNCHAGEIAGVIAQSSCGLAKMRQWRKQKSEYARTTGYSILCQMLKDDAESVDEVECKRILRDVEMEIHRSPNRARHAMVMAVISIGIYRDDLRDEAIEAGERIGKVSVDHGDTSCTTPQIVPYINKAVKQSRSKGRSRVRSC